MGLIIKCMFLSYAISKMEFLLWPIQNLPDCLIKYILIVLLSCTLCNCFWTTLIVTHSLFDAALAYFIMKWYIEIEDVIKMKLMKWK